MIRSIRFKLCTLFLFMFAILFSCKKKEEHKIEYRLTAEDKTWNIYHKGDTIKFKSNFNHYRNYYIFSNGQGVHNPQSTDYWNSYEDILIVLNRIDSLSNDNNFQMSMVRGYPGDSQKGFLIMIWWFDDWDLPYIFNLPRTPNIDTITVNNILYQNVYKFDNPKNTTVDSAAKRIFYDKQKGWLRFELNSGETYDRIN